jgi:hypothetical protein
LKFAPSGHRPTNLPAENRNYIYIDLLAAVKDNPSAAN